MSYEDIFKNEERTSEDIYLIHLYSEGMWWRAYEWSAYLCNNLPSSNDEKLKVTKKSTKYCDEGIVFVGLQMSSFKKYFPGVYENDKVEQIDDKHIVLDVKEMLNNVSVDNYKEILKDWKNTIHETSKKTNEKNSFPFVQSSQQGVSSILNDIVNYQIINHTLLDSVIFLSEIQNKIIKLK